MVNFLIRCSPHVFAKTYTPKHVVYESFFPKGFVCKPTVQKRSFFTGPDPAFMSVGVCSTVRRAEKYVHEGYAVENVLGLCSVQVGAGRFGTYTFAPKILGQGGSSTVLKITSEGQSYAAKVFFFKKAETSTRSKMLDAELNAHMHMQKKGMPKGVLPLLGAFEVPSELSYEHGTFKTVLLLFPLVEDGTLERPESNGIETPPMLCVPEVFSKGLALARILAQLHERGVAHMDVKPSNVFACFSEVQLFDFGVSRIFSEPSEKIFFPKRTGSPYFMAPELNHMPQEGAWLNPQACDVYSLGKTFAYMLHIDIKHVGPHSTCEVFDAYPEMAFLVRSMLHEDPSHRPSMEEVVKTLEALTNKDA